jgi:hypothetical protein
MFIAGAIIAGAIVTLIDRPGRVAQQVGFSPHFADKAAIPREGARAD